MQTDKTRARFYGFKDDSGRAVWQYLAFENISYGDTILYVLSAL